MSPLRIGYVLWDYPALSQTFVLSEIEQLVANGHDVHVYFHVAPDRAAGLDFEVPAFQVADPNELAALLVEHGRTMLHSHFAYPAVTRLTYPAAVAAGMPFTFMVHAVDIFHREEHGAERDRRDRSPTSSASASSGRVSTTARSSSGAACRSRRSGSPAKPVESNLLHRSRSSDGCGDQREWLRASPASLRRRASTT